MWWTRSPQRCRAAPNAADSTLTGMVELTAAKGRAVAYVDLGAVERNCATLKRRLGPAALCAVVKADGYGHGATTCAGAAIAGGATWLAVATANEAATLREEGVTGRILVMGALTGAELAVAIAADADVVAWRGGFVRAVAAAAQDRPA